MERHFLDFFFAAALALRMFALTAAAISSPCAFPSVTVDASYLRMVHPISLRAASWVVSGSSESTYTATLPLTKATGMLNSPYPRLHLRPLFQAALRTTASGE